MTRWSELGRKIAQEQDALQARSTVRAEVRARLESYEPPAQRTAWAAGRADRLGRFGSLQLWAAAAACLLGGAFSYALWSKQHEPVALAVTIGDRGLAGAAGSWVEAPSKASLAMRFSDGTRMDVSASSRVRIAELGSNGAHVLLENGLARVNVRHRAASQYRVSAGPFAVKVTGTRFDIRWTPENDAFELDLHEGHVELSGCVFGQSYALRAGQRAAASCRHGQLSVGAANEPVTESALRSTPPGTPAPLAAPAALPPAASPEPPAASAAVPASQAPAQATPSDVTEPPAASSPRSHAAREHAARPTAEPRWQAWAEAGRYADALAAVRSTGFGKECARANASQLLLLSDLARYGRDHDDAVSALRLLRQRFPRTRQAARAAFSLGGLDSDHDGSHAEAAGWFRTYLSEQPGGALAREASGRLLEATLRAGDTAGARELAIQYLHDYPGGPHSALATSLRTAAH